MRKVTAKQQEVIDALKALKARGDIGRPGEVADFLGLPRMKIANRFVHMMEVGLLIRNGYGYETVEQPVTKHAKPNTGKPKTRRICICGCGTPFMSEGPHHRMAEYCRQRKTSVFDNYGGGTGRSIQARYTA